MLSCNSPFPVAPLRTKHDRFRITSLSSSHSCHLAATSDCQHHFWLSALRVPHGSCGLTTCAPSPLGWLSHPPWWIVTSTTTMGTPFPWRSPSLGNPVFRHDETSRAQRRCLTHHLHEASLAPILPARIPRTATLFRVQKGSGCKRSARGRVLPSSVIEVRAILPSPYCAERGSPQATTLWLFARFLGMLLSPPLFRVR